SSSTTSGIDIDHGPLCAQPRRPDPGELLRMVKISNCSGLPLSTGATKRAQDQHRYAAAAKTTRAKRKRCGCCATALKSSPGTLARLAPTCLRVHAGKSEVADLGSYENNNIE
ncbi:MAG: hypothetical protein AABZ10_10670, partial [Nitrospirota bacterium]